MSDRNVSNNNLFEQINQLRLEIKSDINRVSNKVDKVQEQVNKNEIKQTITSTKLVMLISGISLIVSAVITVAIERILK